MIALHQLFESQSKSLTASELGDRTIVRSVRTVSLSLHDAYVLGYCISQSSCQWKLNLKYIGDEHAEVLKRGIVSWGAGEGKIAEIHLYYSRLTSEGIGHFLSLPPHVVRGLSELVVHRTKRDVTPYEKLAHHVSSLPYLKRLSLRGYGIDGEGAQLFSQFLRTNTTLRELDLQQADIKTSGLSSLAKALSANNSLHVLNLSSNQIDCEGAQLLSVTLRTNTTLTQLCLSRNVIKDKGGCSLAKALSVNKGLETLIIYHNPLGEATIRKLIGSLQRNHTLESIHLPGQWKELAHRCNGYKDTKRHFYFSS